MRPLPYPCTQKYAFDGTPHPPPKAYLLYGSAWNNRRSPVTVRHDYVCVRQKFVSYLSQWPEGFQSAEISKAHYYQVKFSSEHFLLDIHHLSSSQHQPLWRHLLSIMQLIIIFMHSEWIIDCSYFLQAFYFAWNFVIPCLIRAVSSFILSNSSYWSYSKLFRVV